MSQLPNLFIAIPLSLVEERVRISMSILDNLMRVVSYATNTYVQNIIGNVPNGASTHDLEVFMRPRPGRAPATQASINNLSRVELVDPDMECPICLVNFGDGSRIVKEMPCKHQFCQECIENWLRLHSSCPLCRFCIPADERMEILDIESGGWRVRFNIVGGALGEVVEALTSDRMETPNTE